MCFCCCSIYSKELHNGLQDAVGLLQGNRRAAEGAQRGELVSADYVRRLLGFAYFGTEMRFIGQKLEAG